MKSATTIWFEKIGNRRVFCILTQPPKSTKTIVIMSHGFRGSSIGPARTFVDFSDRLVQHGFATLRLDQPGCGNSDGDFLDVSFRQWVGTIRALAEKYLKRGYRVILLGQSMGATATMVAAAAPKLRQRIPALLLWVPDPKTMFAKNPKKMFEEAGQRYRGRFWAEARDADFMSCLQQYPGHIHLVYGEYDRYMTSAIRQRVLALAKKLGHKTMILPGQDHSPWQYAVAQKVYTEEIRFLKRMLNT